MKVRCTVASVTPFLIAACIGSLLVITVGCAGDRTDRAATQKQVAIELGVDPQQVDQYKYFPLDYFMEALKPGMVRQEVHRIVRSYEKVFRCGQFTEVYYFYSASDSKALRMQIIYDEQGRYREIRGEDENSRTISVAGCQEGQLR